MFVMMTIADNGAINFVFIWHANDNLVEITLKTVSQIVGYR